MGFNKGLIISIFLISLISIVVTGLMLEVGNNYDKEVPVKYQNVFDTYDEAKDATRQTEFIISNGTINPDGFDEGLFTNVITASKQIRDGNKLFYQMMNEVPTVFGINPVIIGILASIVFLLGLFGFIKVITKQDP